MKNWDWEKIGIVAAIILAVAVTIWYVTKHTNLLKKGTTTPKVDPPAKGAAGSPAQKMSFASPFVGGQDIEFYQN